MRVRPARPADAEALRAAVSRAGEATVFDDIGAPLLDVSEVGVREAAASADCCFLVEEDGQPMGLALAHPDDDGDAAELLALWVHPERAGENVAKRLLKRLATNLAEEGVDVIRTCTPVSQPSAREFFRSHGFHQQRTVSGHGGEEIVFTAPVESLL